MSALTAIVLTAFACGWLQRAPPAPRHHHSARNEATDPTTVRICYRELWATPAGTNVTDGCEQLRLDDAGRWRLVAHHDLLERVGPRGSIIPEEFADLFHHDPRTRS